MSTLTTCASAPTWLAVCSSSSSRPPRLRCSACLMLRRPGAVFYCHKCVNNGQISHSDPRKLESLSEKQLRQLMCVRTIEALRNRVESATGAVVAARAVMEEAKAARQRIKWINRLIKERSEVLDRVRAAAAKLRDVNEKRVQRLPKFEQKVDAIKKFSMRFSEEVNRERVKLNNMHESLAAARRRHALEISARIFDVAVVTPEMNLGLSDNVLDEQDLLITESLADAMGTSFVNGRWVKAMGGAVGGAAVASDTALYRIVAPALPMVGVTSADYAAACCAFRGRHGSIGSQSSGSGIRDCEDVDQAYTILAGLMLATQWLQHLASALDVILPRRLIYSEFGEITSSEYRFAKRLAKFNLNVVYLCLSQDVNPNLIVPTHSMHNLKLLLDSVLDPTSRFGKPAHAILTMDRLQAFSCEIAKELDKAQRTADDLVDDEDDEMHVGPSCAGEMGLEDDWEAVSDLDMLTAMPQLATSSAFFPASFMSSLFRGLTTAGSPKK